MAERRAVDDRRGGRRARRPRRHDDGNRLAPNTGRARAGPRDEPVGRDGRARSRSCASAAPKLVVLVTHAGGWCGETGNPHDLSSCDDGSEIFRLVRELPRGTLQAVVAGHTHGTVAHIVGDVPITSVPNFGVQFGRMDLTFDPILL